ncbi:ABC transporter [Bacteroidetes bacterium UKL13-3]|nr:ABC transporter [Bacteroidetes bacterium UKL13-3]HCP92500.1 ABC transporter [Bacteroidota bacterium]
MKALKHLNKYFYKYRLRFILGILFVTASNLFAVFPAQSVRIAIDLVQENLATYKLYAGTSLQMVVYKQVGSIIIYFALLVMAFALIKGFFMYLMRQTLIVMSRHVEYDLKNEIFNHYQNLPLSFYRKNNTGDLMSRISEDVGRVRMYIGPAVMYIINLTVTIILVLWAMFSVNVKLSIIVLLPLPILSFAIFKVNTIINRRSDAIQSQLSTLTSFVQEAFSGVRVMKAFAVEDDSRLDFEKATEEYYQRSMSLAKVDAMFFPLMVFLTGMSTLLTIGVGGLMVINGEITIGNVAEFVLYVNLLTWPVASLGFTSSLIQRAAASQQRINEFLQTQPDIASVKDDSFAFEHEITFKNVSYTYEGKTIPALSNVSFVVPKGKTLAILGSTGSGKTTIVQLLLRMMDVTNGQILIDGKELKDIDIRKFKAQVGYAPQDVFMFSDTIAHNISFGLASDTPELSSRIQKAAKNAALTEAIDDFQQGFETVVGERGITLSGGQKQRVSIARALIKDPEVLILDDCLSAVDTKTESEILNNLKKLTIKKTAIIISHRVSSVKDADYIIVLDAGMIVEEGTHQSLLHDGKRYFELYQRQMTDD